MPEPAKTEEELLARLPKNIWIQMPGTEDATPEVAEPENIPTPQTHAQTPPAAAPKPAAETPKAPPAPVVPQEPVRVAPIAEWPAEPVRRRPPAVPPAPAAAEETATDKKGKRRGGKKAAVKEPKAPAAKKRSGRGKKPKVGESDVELGTQVGTSEIQSLIEEPKVRIAEEPALTRTGDRHLATDEPVDPESLRTVSSRRDLDHVPDED